MSVYTNANFKAIVFANVSDKIKTFAESVGVSIWTDGLVTSEEKLFTTKLTGPHDAEQYFQKNIDSYQMLKKERTLSRVYWFQNSGFWFITPELKVKKMISTIRDCQEENLGSEERRRIVYGLLLEGVILLSVALLEFARKVYVWQGNGLKEMVTASLKAGSTSVEDRNSLVTAAFDYVAANKGKIPSNPNQLLDIPAPPYTEALLNYLERIFEHPQIAIQVPRFLDIIVYDFILPNRVASKEELERFFSVDITLLTKLAKNVITFLERATGFPKELMEPLLKL